ncbi:MAG: GntR family transcriptional regulator [Burkholderiaceae bacterium]
MESESHQAGEVVAAPAAINSSAPVGPQLHQLLRQRIIRNDLAPGTRISESEIAATYSVSRQPVREAFIKLAEEGFVEVQPQRGTVIRKISDRAVTDAQFVREAVEADIIKLVARQADPALVAELRVQLTLQAKAAEAGDPARFIVLDEYFHHLLARAAGKERAWGLVQSLKSHMDRVRHLSVRKMPIDALIRQHRLIVDAIADGGVERAEAAVRSHLREILRDLPAIAAAFPEFFDDTPG